MIELALAKLIAQSLHCSLRHDLIEQIGMPIQPRAPGSRPDFGR
jgi:hypothetical protein